MNIADAVDRKKLIESMKLWSEKDTSIRMGDIVKDLDLKVPRHVFLDWTKLYPDLYDAYYQAKMATAKRRKIHTRENRQLIEPGQYTSRKRFIL